VVVVETGRCIGCKYCVAACPYQVRVQNEETGTVDKCRFCTISALNGTKMCSCVTACLTGARIFGDLDDPQSELSKAIVELNAHPLAGDLTKAKVFYVR
jgi:Fe-S-cluster-containing dehydrogenase component